MNKSIKNRLETSKVFSFLPVQGGKVPRLIVRLFVNTLLIVLLISFSSTTSFARDVNDKIRIASEYIDDIVSTDGFVVKWNDGIVYRVAGYVDEPLREEVDDVFKYFSLITKMDMQKYKADGPDYNFLVLCGRPSDYAYEESVRSLLQYHDESDQSYSKRISLYDIYPLSYVFFDDENSVTHSICLLNYNKYDVDKSVYVKKMIYNALVPKAKSAQNFSNSIMYRDISSVAPSKRLYALDEAFLYALYRNSNVKSGQSVKESKAELIKFMLRIFN